MQHRYNSTLPISPSFHHSVRRSLCVMPCGKPCRREGNPPVAPHCLRSLTGRVQEAGKLSKKLHFFPSSLALSTKLEFPVCASCCERILSRETHLPITEQLRILPYCGTSSPTSGAASVDHPKSSQGLVRKLLAGFQKLSRGDGRQLERISPTVNLVSCS